MKKAFTLTELLMVVLVLGVLATVSVPKMKQVLETRRTTEAENMMGAIRSEQEKRCVSNKSYSQKWSSVQNVAPKQETSSYKYTLTPTGVIASGSAYSLQMPSYADGRICCSGAGCNSLNKSYPLCNSEFSASLSVAAECEATDAEEEADEPICENQPDNLTEVVPCGCKNGGTKTNIYDTNTCSWVEGICDISDDCACSGTTPGETQACEPSAFPGQACGIQQALYDCDPTTGEYVFASWHDTCTVTDACQVESGDCCASDFEGDFLSCIANKYGTSSAEYKCSSGQSSACFSALGIYTGTNGSTPNYSAEGQAFVNGGYKNYACSQTVPCMTDMPSDSSSCNGCGTRSAVYECINGKWEWTSVGECSKTAEECGKCSNVGSSWSCPEEDNCSVTEYTCTCSDGSSYSDIGTGSTTAAEFGSIAKTKGSRTLKDGAECYYGQQKTENGKSYYCNSSTCKWQQTSTGGGGGGGGGYSCRNWTDMYSGSFCRTCGCMGVVSSVSCI